LPDDFEKMVATMRSRNVSVSIILQNMAQLKALFEKCWESIEGNCDEFLYLGGNEASTHKYISEKIGNATIDTNTYGLSYGKNGSSSKNDQNTGRALMTPEQVREMDRNYCVLFISGEKAVYDRKIQTLEHPNVDFTPLKGNKDLIYRHGEVDMPHSDLEIVTDETDADNSYDYDTEDVSMAVITSSDIIKYIKKEKTK
jgi:type IV secretion system protein VirD4